MPIPADYAERVYAGVLGKLIGVYLGRPFEGWDFARIMRELGPIKTYVHDRLGVPLVVTDDDIAGTFAFVRALEDHGFDPQLDAARIGETWLNTIVERRTILWWGGIGRSTEETAWRRLAAGIPAPESGSAATNGRTIAEQIGAQIFIDGWALVSPGNAAQAAHLAQEAARVSHDGEAVFAAMLIAVMEALAFVEPDLDRLLDAGLAAIPADCLVARVAADVRQWCAANRDWETTRALIEAQYGYHLYPGACHVIPNHAVVLMALLYGRDDFSRAMLIACTAGWDTDCNAGNVGCLLGIRLGLAGLDSGPDRGGPDRGGPDWRGPIADRLLLSSADGGEAITDAVRVTERLVRSGYRLARQPDPVAPKAGARFHFPFAGSLQGFAVTPSEHAAAVEIAHVQRDAGARGLAVRYRDLDAGRTAIVETPTFMPPEVTSMRTYELMASPTLHPGQTVRAHVLAEANHGAVDVALTLAVYGADDRLERVSGPSLWLSASRDEVLCWTVPDLGGRPVASVGIAITAGSEDARGTIHLDWLDWSGTPEIVLRRPDAPGRFWRRAWVDAVSLTGDTAPSAFQLSQDDGRGLLIYGARDWTSVRVESEITVGLGAGGLAACVQGLRRYYALLLRRPDRLVLLKVWDGAERVLAEQALAWEWGRPVRLGLVARGTTVIGEVAGRTLLEVEDRERPLLRGAVALALETGALSTDAVAISTA